MKSIISQKKKIIFSNCTKIFLEDKKHYFPFVLQEKLIQMHKLRNSVLASKLIFSNFKKFGYFPETIFFSSIWRFSINQMLIWYYWFGTIVKKLKLNHNMRSFEKFYPHSKLLQCSAAVQYIMCRVIDFSWKI